MEASADRKKQVRQFKIMSIAYRLEDDHGGRQPRLANAQHDDRPPTLLADAETEAMQQLVVGVLGEAIQLGDGVVAQHPELGAIGRAAGSQRWRDAQPRVERALDRKSTRL